MKTIKNIKKKLEKKKQIEFQFQTSTRERIHVFSSLLFPFSFSSYPCHVGRKTVMPYSKNILSILKSNLLAASSGTAEKMFY
jgi:hypothetical protein